MVVLVAGVLGCSVDRQALERPRPEAETVPFVDAHVHLWLALIESKAERFIVGTDASHRSRESEIMKCDSVQAFLRQLSPVTQDRVARTNLLKLVDLNR